MPHLSRSRPILAAAISAIVALVVFNVAYWIVWPQAFKPELVSPDIISSSSLPVTTNSSPMFSEVVIAAGLLIAAGLVGVVVWIMTIKWQAKQRVVRDEQRKLWLQKVVQGMDMYKAQKGHYPLGSNSAQRLVPATGMGYEWESLGFPQAEEMRRYLADWPVVDPLVTYDQHVQQNQYLYYPLSNGEHFALYAHLESRDPSLPDFNALDGLPTAWGHYNYKVSSEANVVATPVEASAAPAAISQPNNSSVTTVDAPHQSESQALSESQLYALGGESLDNNKPAPPNSDQPK